MATVSMTPLYYLCHEHYQRGNLENIIKFLIKNCPTTLHPSLNELIQSLAPASLTPSDDVNYTSEEQLVLQLSSTRRELEEAAEELFQKKQDNEQLVDQICEALVSYKALEISNNFSCRLLSVEKEWNAKLQDNLCGLKLENSELKKKIADSGAAPQVRDVTSERHINYLKNKLKAEQEASARKESQAKVKIAEFENLMSPLAKENQELRSKITKLQKKMEEDRKKKSEEISELEAKIALLMDKSLLQCQICFSDSEISNRRLYPCGHMMCATCAPKFNVPPKECPFCKQKFTEIQPFHFK